MRLIWSRRSKRRWRNSLAAALILLAGAAAAEDIPVAAIGDQPIEVTGAEGSGTLLVFSSRPLLARMPAITRLLVMIHGVRRDGDQALAQGLSAIGGAADQTLVVAPQFLSEADFQRWVLPSDRLRWPAPGWEEGDVALGPSSLSPFSALDSLVAGLADPGLLPNLKAITIAGQAEGADLVQLYAGVTTRLSGLEARGLTLRFVLAEPTRYLYFDPARPVPTDPAACPRFDQWPFGLDAAPAYLALRQPAGLFAQYRARDVVYLLSQAAPVPAGEIPCALAAEGPNETARGRYYLGYLAMLAGAPVHHLAEIATGAATQPVWGNPCGVAALLDQPGCPALAAAPVMTAFPVPAPPDDHSKSTADTATAPEAAPEAPVTEAVPPPAAPDQVEPGGLADPLHDADPLSPLLTRPPPRPKPASPPG
jgi:hypothetical protein